MDVLPTPRGTEKGVEPGAFHPEREVFENRRIGAGVAKRHIVAFDLHGKPGHSS